MIYFFEVSEDQIIAVDTPEKLESGVLASLSWAFGNARLIEKTEISGFFVGPRKEMITPWSTNAIEIASNMGIQSLIRAEEYFRVENKKASFDPMLRSLYKNLNQSIFTIDRKPEPVIPVTDIQAYNQQEGLALSAEEVKYLENLSEKLGRKLTDSEVFGFSQVNSEHCRHKIFNGIFIIDGVEKKSSLFQLIKKTTLTHRNKVVSAYKDNCAFLAGPGALQFAPARQDRPEFFEIREIDTILSLKAETHNFPTTVEPFNGASTGTGGEIRDRMGGGKGSLPLGGTAVYMTSYPRTENARKWEEKFRERKWLYQSPREILIKASNGASDFGNKFGQPLVCGSLLTFEHFEANHKLGYDKVIMLAGGIGYGKKEDTHKDVPAKGDVIVLLGGDNYRIGMGGGAVSSVATGEYEGKIELNAVQRANPEMQKRVYNVIRALAESSHNPIISIHDHGAGGHLNCLSELVEETGGVIYLNKLPVGDPTLSSRELIGNESQERMGLVIKKEDVNLIQAIADRERAPVYIIGEVTGDMQFTFLDEKRNEKPIDLELADFFGNPPVSILKDSFVKSDYSRLNYDEERIEDYIISVLQLEAVACKDWLTNKVDRSVTGRVAKQQCCGPLQLPLNNLGAMSLDYLGDKAIATSIGHAPQAGLIDPAAGSVLSIAEALTNIIWAPLADGLKSISLSANWMWPCRNAGEDSRLFAAAQAASDFALALGINIPTGKDSLSMTQKYKDEQVLSPGTVIISAAAETLEASKIVEPVLKKQNDSLIVYVDLSSDLLKTGGSAFSQSHNKLDNEAPTVKNPGYFVSAFQAIQQLVHQEKIIAGHDISAGGMLTTLLEMCFPVENAGMELRFSHPEEKDLVKLLFAENPGVILQLENDSPLKELDKQDIKYIILGKPSFNGELNISANEKNIKLDVSSLRDKWFYSSYLLDKDQSVAELATERYKNYKNNVLSFKFGHHKSTFESAGLDPRRTDKSGIKAAIIREKGVNGDREMAYAMHLAGMDVKDVHMTDLISGRENLKEVNMIVFVGGFSNSDVLGSAKGWAGAFRYNDKARKALENFYQRKDTLSLGVCNGCQLMVELGLLYPEGHSGVKMLHNDSGKFESAFLSVDIPDNNSVMLKSLANKKLGIWVAHGEGKFSFQGNEKEYLIPMKYSANTYPANPNGSDFSTAAICSANGRHLAMMPHIERAVLPWQWGYYPDERKQDEISPWLEAFVNARNWIEANS